MEEKAPSITTSSELVSLSSIEEKAYSAETYVKVNEYYKRVDLWGISFRDVKRIKDVSKKTSIAFAVFKELMLGISMAFLGALLGKLISGMHWNLAKDLIYFFISLLCFIITLFVYIAFCMKQYYDKDKLIDALEEHLFVPLGMGEKNDNDE